MKSRKQHKSTDPYNKSKEYNICLPSQGCDMWSNLKGDSLNRIFTGHKTKQEPTFTKWELQLQQQEEQHQPLSPEPKFKMYATLPLTSRGIYFYQQGTANITA